jgi:hypothetical protein
MSAYSLYAETIEIDLKLFKGTDWPQWNFEQPYTVVSTVENDLVQNVKVNVNLESTSTSIVLNNFGKSINDTVIEQDKIVRDQAIEIQKIWVNGVLLELMALQDWFEFYPQYQQSDQEYADQNGISLPRCRNETKLFYNGRWQFKFDQPFFYWYNDKLMAGFSNINHWAKQSNLGLANDSQLQRLDNLLDQLSR